MLILLDALLDFVLVLFLLEMPYEHEVLGKSLVLLFDLRELHFVLIPVAARGVLVPVLIVSFDCRFQFPNLIEQVHVLALDLRLLLLVPEVFGCCFCLSECFCEGVNLVFPLEQVTILLAIDGFDMTEVLLVLFLCLFLEEVVLVDGAGGDDECLHN